MLEVPPGSLPEVYLGPINDECTLADIVIDVGLRSDCVVLHVLKHAELVENVDAEFVDEGIIVIVSEQRHRITGYSMESLL
jgi:hypothetical protein